MKSSTKDDDEKSRKSKDVKTWKNVVKCPHIASLTLVALVAIGILCPKHMNIDAIDFFGIENMVHFKQEEQIVSKNGPIPGCYLFSGKWVYDNVSYPLYKEGECSFMGYRFPACQKFGRKDLQYQKWRWQPHNCDIPRFNGSAFLEKMRGKKLMFVGDSVGRNQWESMLCLVKSYIPLSSLKSWKLDSKGNFLRFYSIAYKVTIGFYWAPFLVESNVDNPRNHSVYPRTVRIKSIQKHGRHWIDADFLIFDAFAWWAEHWVTLLWGSFGSPNAIHKELEINPRIYEMALNTWSEWLEMQINPNKTKMFFMGHSPFHYGPQVSDIFHCQGHKEPIFDDKYWPSSVKHSMMQIVEFTIKKLEQRGVKVEYLNVTQLSGYRIDAHPSVYMDKPFWRHFSDCLHWCLPGVPDVWNQILYTYIMNS